MALDVNTASRDALVALKGIGEEIVDAIIQARPLTSIDGLLSIPGIGKVTLGRLKQQELIVAQREPARRKLEQDQFQSMIQVTAEFYDDPHADPQEMLTRDGVETLDDLKLEDISALGERTGLSETLLRELLLRGELANYSVPRALADALVASGTIGRAGELTAIDVEAIQALLESSHVEDVSTRDIEVVKDRIPRSTLDEETTRGVLEEGSTRALHDETERALVAEDPKIAKAEVEALVSRLDGNLRQFYDKALAISRGPGETVELATLQSLIESLEADFRAASAQLLGELQRDKGGATGEDETAAFADEEADIDLRTQPFSQQMATIQQRLAGLEITVIPSESDVQTRTLSRQIGAIQRQLAALEMTANSLDEETSPSAAKEEDSIVTQGE